MTVTIWLAEAVHPAVLVTVTVYVLEVLTVVAAVTAALLHAYEDPPEAVSVTLPGAQKVVAPDGVIAAVGMVIAKEPVSGLVRS